jgi:hypothetical protein
MHISTKFITGAFYALLLSIASSPAYASWLCFNDGGGCYEFSDGICGSSSVQSFATAHDMTCFGPVRESREIKRIDQLFKNAQTTAGGKKRLGKLKEAARQFEEK